MFGCSWSAPCTTLQALYSCLLSLPRCMVDGSGDRSVYTRVSCVASYDSVERFLPSLFPVGNHAPNGTAERIVLNDWRRTTSSIAKYGSAHARLLFQVLEHLTFAVTPCSGLQFLGFLFKSATFLTLWVIAPAYSSDGSACWMTTRQAAAEDCRFVTSLLRTPVHRGQFAVKVSGTVGVRTTSAADLLRLRCRFCRSA